jgi:Transposase DDE domain
MKLTVGLDLRGHLPAFAAITESKKADSECTKLLTLPKGSIVVCDRGYNDYGWYKSLTVNGVFASPGNAAMPLTTLWNAVTSRLIQRSSAIR